MSNKPIDLMWDDEPVNVTSEVNFIWSIANKLRGPYRSDKYKDVIIPMVIIRRLECALEDTKEKVLARFDIDPDLPTQVFCRTSGYDFYNTSKYDLAELVNEPDNIAGNFREYIKGFSANVQDIIRSLEFDKQIDKMDENDRLYSVVKAFSELDLSPKTIDNVKMGYIFEDLIRRFSENAEAGDHYTGRDIIKTMVSIILAEGCDDIFDDNKEKNELSPEDREQITRLYADFKENDLCKIYDNEEFMYREYSVMQPLQRSYGITEERIQNMLSSGALNSLYDEAKVYALENAESLTGKEEKKLEAFYEKKPTYDAIIDVLKSNISDNTYMNPESFMPILTEILKGLADKKLLEKIADGLSVMDKKADIQKDKKGNIIYDKTTKDTEIVKYQESIEDYMDREVLPHVPDAKYFFEENLGAKNPVIKTGAEIPFTRYFYKYQQPESSKVLEQKFIDLEKSVNERIAKLFKED